MLARDEEIGRKWRLHARLPSLLSQLLKPGGAELLPEKRVGGWGRRKGKLAIIWNGKCTGVFAHPANPVVLNA